MSSLNHSFEIDFIRYRKKIYIKEEKGKKGDFFSILIAVLCLGRKKYKEIKGKNIDFFYRKMIKSNKIEFHPNVLHKFLIVW